MKKILFVLALTLAFASCANKKLYSWGNYNNATYTYLKNQNEKSIAQLIESYEKIIAHQTGIRKTVPPGIYADYGFLLLQSNRTEEGKSMLEKEINLYPESAVFINRILKMIDSNKK